MRPEFPNSFFFLCRKKKKKGLWLQATFCLFRSLCFLFHFFNRLEMNEEVADERVTQAVNYVSSINAWQWQAGFNANAAGRDFCVREERREPAASEEKWAH